MTTLAELKDRIEARKHDLLAKLNELKADTRHEASATRDKLKVKLDELEVHLKEGWEKMSEAVKGQLGKWLDHDDHKGDTKPTTEGKPLGN